MIVKIKRLVLGVLCLLAASTVGADPLPFDVTVYGLYGAPTQPDVLSHSHYDGLGFGGLFEWNPSYYASLGLGYEQTGFYGKPDFSAGTLNLEGKYFISAFLQDYAPYISAGVGLNVAPAQWKGNWGLKVGVGDRFPLFGPTLMDVGFDYHWMTDPGSFQYADLHAGLGLAFDIQGGASSPAKPTSVPTPEKTVVPAETATPAVTATVSITPITTPESIETSTPTPEIVFSPEPTPSATEETPAVSKMRHYYRLGVSAFLQRRYTTSAADLKICVRSKDTKIPTYYYAEAYSTLGVIDEFHRTFKGHVAVAEKYYQKALKIDPKTHTARKYMSRLKAKPERKPVTVTKDSSLAMSDKGASMTAIASPTAEPESDSTPVSNN